MWARLVASVQEFTGEEEYKFGSITRSAVGRFTGSRHYQFGDISRTIASRTTEHLQHVFNTWQPRLEAPPEASPQDVTMTDLWGSFFKQSELVCLESLRALMLDVDDVEGLEPFLFLGLAALTLLEVVLRSRGGNGLQLACGIAVTAHTVPEEVAELYSALAQCKVMAEEHALGPEDEEFLRYAVLFAEAEESEVQEPSGVSEERKTLLRRSVVGAIRSVATQVTQLPFYKSNYLDVLQSAALRYRDPPDK
eukprot:TRINITY_DN16041_c0_g1_i1.p1 TRINITY_DN16041_c0_g1~~TRINITY_DN16041_c0_g1_i1.p1  ORF type:complete len:251 (+),score=63.67 TRINITY_DN16041_c0_g1_i1:188-940(+)